MSDFMVVPEARKLLKQFSESSEVEPGTLPDDLLVFFRTLRDRWMVSSSKSPRLSGKSFTPLSSLIMNLESDPDRTLQSPDEREFIRLLLEDLVTGRILVHPKEE